MPLYMEGIEYCLSSGETESGYTSSIQIEEKEYSLGQRGINLAVFDTFLNEVVCTAAFDTCAVPIAIPVDTQ